MKRIEVAQHGISEFSATARIGAFGQKWQRVCDSAQEAFGYLFSGFFHIPTVLLVEVGVKFISALQRQFYFRCFARCSCNALSAISRSSLSRYGLKGPFAAFNNSASSSGLSSSKFKIGLERFNKNCSHKKQTSRARLGRLLGPKLGRWP